MSTCILTVVKNEHAYLKEWIQYHLSLGIDHIFIFEDIDSDSHRAITDEYAKVSCIPLSDCLFPNELEKARRFKENPSKNPHTFYLRHLLPRVSRKHRSEYDWCFVIDDDEFITLDPGLSLSQALKKYNGYDAVILQWRCFGAGGRISCPDQPVLSTYGEVMAGEIPNYPQRGLTKTCYNLHTYRDAFYATGWFAHQPGEKCNCCCTDFQRSRTHVTYDTMYLRHYITRSYEEYLWKRRERGYLSGLSRPLDAFFAMNPDLSFLKEDLLFAADNEILVVLPYRQSKSQGTELRLALGGWRKNCEFKYHFAVIGEFDEDLAKEFDWVDFIRVPNLPGRPGQYNPHLNMLRAYEAAYKRFGDRYPGFLTMADDCYPIRPFSYFELYQTRYLRDSFTGTENLPASYWRHDKWKTRRLLDEEGLPHVNYTTHFPCYYNFKRLLEIWDRFGMRDESYVLEDVYFNYFEHEKPFPVQDIRYGVWGKARMGEPLEKALADPHVKFICNSVEGWSPELERILGDAILGEKSLEGSPE